MHIVNSIKITIAFSGFAYLNMIVFKSFDVLRKHDIGEKVSYGQLGQPISRSSTGLSLRPEWMGK